MKITDFATTKSLTGAIMYLEFTEDRAETFILSDLTKLLKGKASRNVLSMCLLSLESDGSLVKAGIRTGDKLPEQAYKLTPSGLTTWERVVRDNDDYFKKLFGLVNDDQGATAPPKAEMVDPTGWSPLPLDRENPSFKDAVSSVETLLERVRGDNGYAATDASEHQSIVWSLQIGLDAIKERLPTRQQLNDLLLSPLRYLATKFAAAAIGDLANKAIEALLTWLGWR